MFKTFQVKTMTHTLLNLCNEICIPDNKLMQSNSVGSFVSLLGDKFIMWVGSCDLNKHLRTNLTTLVLKSLTSTLVFAAFVTWALGIVQVKSVYTKTHFVLNIRIFMFIILIWLHELILKKKKKTFCECSIHCMNFKIFSYSGIWTHLQYRFIHEIKHEDVQGYW